MGCCAGKSDVSIVEEPTYPKKTKRNQYDFPMKTLNDYTLPEIKKYPVKIIPEPILQKTKLIKHKNGYKPILVNHDETSKDSPRLSKQTKTPRSGDKNKDKTPRQTRQHAVTVSEMSSVSINSTNIAPHSTFSELPDVEPATNRSMPLPSGACHPLRASTPRASKFDDFHYMEASVTPIHLIDVTPRSYRSRTSTARSKIEKKNEKKFLKVMDRYRPKETALMRSRRIVTSALGSKSAR